MQTSRSGTSARRYAIWATSLGGWVAKSGSIASLANTFSIAASDLKGLIEKTRFAISTEETRYYLNGIYLHEVAAFSATRSTL